MRVSDRAREAVVRQLGHDCARGYLSLETLAWRIERAFAARHSDELAGLRADLPPSGPLARLVERLSLWSSRRRHAACVPCSPPPPARPGEAYVLGRGAGCHLVLDDRAVSRRHAELRFESGSWLLVDVGSRNGTRVNGWLVSQAHLSDGDELVLGRTRLRFHPPRAT
jgi:FHA domain/Domain of unknown function (DUF1707)